MQDIILSMQNISKRFPGVLALDDVTLDVRRGEIHALIGENGAGKSTLMKILGGVFQPDQGKIIINGKETESKTPADAIHNKIGVIYQEFNLVSSLSVYENLYLGREIHNKLGFMDRKEMKKRAAETLSKLGFENFDTSQRISTLSIAMQQMVEIGKAIFNDIDILVLDEPTAVLTERESNLLFRTLRLLKEKGVTILYISHRLEEIIEISDRVTVLRDGKYVDTLDNSGKDIPKDRMVELMVGRKLENYYPPRHAEVLDEIGFEVRGISSPGLFENVSFSIRKGEVVGFAGLVGAGRSEIMKSVLGLPAPEKGEVLVCGRKFEPKDPALARKMGLVMLPEDRKKEGLVLGMSMQDNIALPNLDKISSRAQIISMDKKKSLVSSQFEDLHIHPADPQRAAVHFSGGNQQKGVLAKWIISDPSVIVLDEPTRGIDIGAKAEIYALIDKLAQKGVAVAVISSELPELLGICDRILVVNSGRIAAEFPREKFDQTEIMRAAAM